ncbi:MAG: family 43 glycosylhydrolase, partial [Lacrimispora sp.]
MSQKLPVLSGDTYCNPVPFSDGRIHTNPDPFILRWCGRYYCYATDERGVKVSISKDMVQWEDKGYAITDSGYHCYWAPSVIYLNGVFYMYYSNIPSETDDCHQQHLKLAKAVSPLGPFVWEKTFFGHFSIDSHPAIWNGKMYMFYSVNDWLGTEEKIAGTCILMDEMLSPEEFAGKPHPVVLPSLRKEIYKENRFGDGRDWYTIEGACPVFRDGGGWLLYSANAYEHEDYFVGTAAAKTRERLDDM